MCCGPRAASASAPGSRWRRSRRFRIGGPAALFLEPEAEADLRAAGQAVRETGIPFVVLGKGSNVLVSDDGYPGLVLRLGKGYRWTARDGSSG